MSPSVLCKLIAAGCSPIEFKGWLDGVNATERDAWWNEILSLRDVPADGLELPRGCVPYMPSPVDALVRMVEFGPVTTADVFVDVGCGIGRAALFVHLLSGARSVGVDVQSQMVNTARASATDLGLADVEFLVGDACEYLPAGTVYFLYCPFGADRVKVFMDRVRVRAKEQSLIIACLDLALPTCDWLVLTHRWPDLMLYRSVTSAVDRVRSMEPVSDA